jgi:gas vesicle protein
MRYKATFIAGFAVGFLAGARSGRGTYDKIVSVTQQVASHPKVQQATGAAQAKATDLAKTAAAKAPDYAKSAAKTAQDQVSQVPKYVSTAKQAAQSKLPPKLGGTSGPDDGSGDPAAGGTASAQDDVAADGNLVYPVDGSSPSVNGIRYAPDTP